MKWTWKNSGKNQTNYNMNTNSDITNKRLWLCLCGDQNYPCNRQWRPIGLWDVKAPTFSRQSANRWQWGCQSYAPATPLPPARFLILIFVIGWVDPRVIVWLEVLGQLRNPMTASAIEALIFLLVAYCLNQLHYHMPRLWLCSNDFQHRIMYY
jgi:hypothetical protein